MTRTLSHEWCPLGDLFQWNGGSGSFSDPTQWTDVTNPDETGQEAPAAADTADFAAGGSVTGSGSVAEITIEAIVTFNGGFSAGFITNSGDIELAGGSFQTTGNLVSTGTLGVTAGSMSGGYVGNTGTINVSGGSFSSTDFINDSGVITVSGSGALHDAGSLTIGGSGNDSLSITGGGSADSAFAELGINGSSGAATISGTGSQWSITGSLIVGQTGAGTLTINSGGTVTLTTFLGVGSVAGAPGTLTVTGTGSSLDVGQSMTIGYLTTGTLSVTAGAHASCGDFLAIGDQDGSGTSGTGYVTIDGAGSVLQVGTSTGIGVGVGASGTGFLTVSNGGRLITPGISVGGAIEGGLGGGNGTMTIASGGIVNDQTGVVGDYDGTLAGATGVVTVTGVGSAWDNSADLFVGNGGAGTLTITSGGEVLDTFGDVGAGTNVNGSVIVTGEGSVWQNTGGLTVGDAGTGSLTISHNGSVTVSGMPMVIGGGTGSTGSVTVTGTGSSLITTTDLTVGQDGTGSLSVMQGAIFTVGGTLNIGDGTGTGTVTVADPQIDGDLNIFDGAMNLEAGNPLVVGGAIDVGVDAGNNATFTLAPGAIAEGGTGALTVGDYGSGTLVIDPGATLDAAASDMAVGVEAGSNGVVQVTGAGAELDTVSLTVAVSGTGSLTVDTGAVLNDSGDMTIGASSDSTGHVTVGDPGSSLDVAGTLTVGADSKKAFLVIDQAVLSVGGNAAAGLNTGSTGKVTIAAGTLAITGTLTDGDFGSGAVLVELGGTLSAGAVTLGAANGGKGSLTADGADTSVQTQSITLGGGGTGSGSLTVTNGAVVSTAGSATIGYAASANLGNKAAINTQGTWGILSDLIVGGAAVGLLSISGAGQVATGGNVTIGDLATSAAEITVSGTLVQAGTTLASTLLVGDTLTVGGAGKGTLIVSAGAVVQPQPDGSGVIDVAAEAKSVGSVTITGTGSVLDGSALAIGGTAAAAGGKGTLTIASGGKVSVSGTTQLWGGDTAALNAGTLSTGQLDIAAKGTLSGAGTVTAGTIADAGTISASGGTLHVNGAIDGAGTIEITAGAALYLSSGAAATDHLKFLAGTKATHLDLAEATAMQATIAGFAAGDTIDLIGIASTELSFAHHVLTIDTAAGSIDLAFTGTYATANFLLGSDGRTGSTVAFVAHAAQYSLGHG